MLGVDVYALSNYSAAAVTKYGNTIFPYVRNELKANAVSIVWIFYASTMTSDSVEVTKSTLSAANVKILTQVAERDGLKVVYRPLIYVLHASRVHWEGNIRPASTSGWFGNYYKTEQPYLKLAQQLRISEFVVETEMHALHGSSGWTSFYKRAAKVYRGTLSYASWEGDYFPPASHLQHVSAVGLDMYEDMPKLSGSASEEQVLAGWENWFRKVPASVLRRTTIQETGIAATADAYHDPANLGMSGRLDAKVQANWFTAACQAVRKYHLRGVFFWKVDLTDNPAHPAASLSTFEGRLGVRAIAGCRSILG